MFYMASFDLQDLADNQEVVARTGRYAKGLFEPKWDPWENMRLSVARNQQGQVVNVALKNKDWAEYDARHDYCPSGVNGLGTYSHGGFLCEDYYLEIQGLK